MRFALLALGLFALGCAPTAPQATAPSPQASFSLPDASRSTLRVVSFGGDAISEGSGVAISSNMVLTNRHVIANELRGGLNPSIIVFDNGADFPRRVSAIVAVDPRLDLAILYVRSMSSAPVTVALAPPSQLESVTALGFPASTDEIFDRVQETVSATSGQVTAVDRGPLGDYGPVDLIMHTATVNPGNSGGPLFNACGELVGVNTLRGNPTQTSNVFVSSSVSEIAPFLASYGVHPQTASRVCGANAPQTPSCTFDQTTLNAAMSAGDLSRLDDAIKTIPPNCTDLRTNAWSHRAQLASAAETAFLNMNGSWRLANATCSNATWLVLSGDSVIGYNGQATQVERITSIQGGMVATRTIHPDDGTEYRYSLNERKLTIRNMRSNQSWELERCTG